MASFSVMHIIRLAFVVLLSRSPTVFAGPRGGKEESSGIDIVIPYFERFGRPTPAPVPAPVVDIKVDNKVIQNSASLVEGLNPNITLLMNELALDPLNQVLMAQLRDKVQEAWASEDGRQLAETLDASGGNQAYEELKQALEPSLLYLCSDFPLENSQFSQTVLDCICRRDSTPTVFCAATADQEIKDYIAASRNAGRERNRKEQSASCELNTPAGNGEEVPDVFQLFEQVVSGDPFCISVDCTIPFAPPLTFLAFEFGGGGCMPGIDLGPVITICEDFADPTSCKTVDELMEEVDDTAYINLFTDTKVFLNGGICLNADEKNPVVEDILIPALEFFGINKCFVELNLDFYFLMGYLKFGVAFRNAFLRINFDLERQFYDDVRAASGVCDRLADDQCSGQEDSDEGQNSCSMCEETTRGSFSGTVQLMLGELETPEWKLFELPFGEGLSGSCIGNGDVRVEVGDPVSYVDLWQNVGYRGNGVLPGASNIGCVVTAAQMQTTFKVIPDDGVDDSSAIQAAIAGINATCPSRSFSFMAVLELPAGVINISREIKVNVNYLIIRGQGNDPNSGSSTKIHYQPGPDTVYDNISDFDLNDMKGAGTANGGWIWPGRGAFRVQSTVVTDRYKTDYMEAPANRNDFFEGSVNFHWQRGEELTENALFGSRTLKVESATRFSVGGFALVLVANSHSFYHRQGVDMNDRVREYMRQQMFTVTAKNGNTITIDKPLEFDAFIDDTADGSSTLCGSGSASLSKVVPLTIVQGIGFENFYLTQIVPGHQPSEAVHNYNNIAKEQAMHGIVFKWAANSYVKNIRTYMTGSHPIVTEAARYMQFEGNRFEGSWNKGKGGNGYLRNSKVWDSLIQDNISIGLRHLTLQWSASGNVVRRNTLDSDLNLHGGWERHNLIEQNIVNIPYGHRDCSPNCDPGAETWYPIWYGAGKHAGGWAGATGPRNIFFNNTLRKQETPGGPFVDFSPYGTERTTVFQFGWDSASGSGRQWQHLSSSDGLNIETWSFNERQNYSPNNGVNDLCSHSGPSLLDASVEQCA